MKKHQGQIEIATSKERKKQNINNPNLVRNSGNQQTIDNEIRKTYNEKEIVHARKKQKKNGMSLQ